MGTPHGLPLAALLLSIALVADSVDHAAIYELGKTRTPACKACQRLVIHMDEQLLPYIMDLQGELKKGRAPRYGQFEELIENTLPKACKSTGIHMERALRKACHDLMDRHEDFLVRSYYKWSQQAEDEMNMNKEICGKISRGRADGGAPACTPELARVPVEELEMMDHPPEEPGSKPRFKTLPAPEGPFKGGGEVNTLVASTFIREVVTEGHGRDALVHFSYGKADAELTTGLREVLKEATGMLGAADVAKTLLVAELDAEQNEIPHPFNAHINGPTLAIYPAERKQNPALLFTVPAGGSGGSADDCPTVADVLSFLHRRGGLEETRRVAGEAVVGSDAEALYSQGQKKKNEEEGGGSGGGENKPVHDEL